MTRSLESRLQKLEAERQAEQDAARKAFLDWMSDNTTLAEYDAFWRWLWRVWDMPPDPDHWGEAQADDEAIAQAVDRRIPLQLINRLRVVYGQAPLTEAERAALEIHEVSA